MIFICVCHPTEGFCAIIKILCSWYHCNDEIMAFIIFTRYLIGIIIDICVDIIVTSSREAAWLSWQCASPQI
jgi:hypothetical protein